MNKIFYISKLPVSTIASAIEPMRTSAPEVKYINNKNNLITRDKFVSKTKKSESNPFIKMRNGFGKLMKHFSKSNNVK